jgi:tripartite-type tricarboxylate transporter receptor subunit TctC
MKNKIFTLLIAACAATTALAATPTDYPNKVIRIVTPYAAGAATDIVTRIIAKDLSEAWGVPVIVENKPGGTGSIGAQAVINSPADGYTLFLGTSATMVTNPLLSNTITYDPFKDFEPIGRITILSPILVAPKNTPAGTVKEMLALARAKPGQLNFASSGTGSPHHLALELMKSLTNIDVVHVPYKGGAPAVVDTISGQVDYGFSNITTVSNYLKSGTLKALAVGSANRSVVLPNVPTMAEAGIPGFDYSLWYGLFAPSKTPKAVIDKISAQLRKTLASSNISSALLSQGAEPAFSTPDETRDFMKKETTLWSKIIKDKHITID